MITPEQKQDIYNRKLKIYANIRFDSLLRDQLNELMNEIATSGDKTFLSRRDKFFSYCNQRNVWYGSETGFNTNYVKLQHKFPEKHQLVIDICNMYGYDIKEFVINAITQNKPEIYAYNCIGSKIPPQVKGHLRARGFDAALSESSLSIKDLY